MADGDSPLIVAIDGPSGVGKSTAARALARRLGLPVLDTGAMYRALALRVLETGLDPGDREAVEELAERTEIDVRPAEDGRLEVLLEGAPVGERIRRHAVSEATSRISSYPRVRRRMVALQRRAAGRAGAVVEGRDIGTVVFPDTPHKFFLRADPVVRAERRWHELRRRGEEVELDTVRRDVVERDARDTGRADSPLRHDESYRLIDTTERSPDEVVEAMVSAIGGG